MKIKYLTISWECIRENIVDKTKHRTAVVIGRGQLVQLSQISTTHTSELSDDINLRYGDIRTEYGETPVVCLSIYRPYISTDYLSAQDIEFIRTTGVNCVYIWNDDSEHYMIAHDE